MQPSNNPYADAQPRTEDQSQSTMSSAQAYVPPAPTSKPRNFLAALLLTMSFGTTGLHQLYLGRPKQAWIRFGLLFSLIPVAVFMLFIPPLGMALGLLAIIAVPVLLVWGIVDVVRVYLNRVDGEGNALEATDRDAKAAKIIFFGAIIMYAILPVLVASTSFKSISNYETLQQRAREDQNQRNQKNQEILDRIQTEGNYRPTPSYQ